MWHPPIGHQLREYTGCDRFYWLSAASGSNQYNCEIINFLDYTALSFASRAFALFLSRLARVAQQKRVCDLATAYLGSQIVALGGLSHRVTLCSCI